MMSRIIHTARASSSRMVRGGGRGHDGRSFAIHEGALSLDAYRACPTLLAANMANSGPEVGTRGIKICAAQCQARNPMGNFFGFMPADPLAARACAGGEYLAAAHECIGAISVVMKSASEKTEGFPEREERGAGSNEFRIRLHLSPPAFIKIPHTSAMAIASRLPR